MLHLRMVWSLLSLSHTVSVKIAKIIDRKIIAMYFIFFYSADAKSGFVRRCNVGNRIKT